MYEVFSLSQCVDHLWSFSLTESWPSSAFRLPESSLSKVDLPEPEMLFISTSPLAGSCRLMLCRTLSRESGDRKSTRLNSSHVRISYAVFCLKKKKQSIPRRHD